jgi:two-component system, sensor histidine kinase and response regulator
MEEKEIRSTILVVDDTETNITILVEALDETYDVSVAMDGESALEAIEDDSPDLVLLDVMMPGMDGFTVCKKLKADERFSDIPIIFLTAKHEVEDITHGFDIGAADYLGKPFQIPELLARVKAHLELKHSKDEIQDKNDEQKEMLHILCHDLANPFASILGVLDLIEEFPDSLDEYIPLLKESARNGVNLIDLVRQIRRTEDKPIELEEVNLSDAVAKSVSTLRTKFEEKKVSSKVDVPESCLVKAEPVSLINSVLNNLLTNAIKFSYPESSIDIIGKCSGDEVELVIQDHGMGMPEDLLGDLFNIRKMTSRPGTDGERGTGFGMPMVQKFMLVYGGEIKIESVEETEGSEGHGTKVILCFTG